MTLTIQPGTPEDYALLAHLHYRDGPPATRVLTLRASIDGQLAGVLIISRPILNAPWRTAAWGGTFAASRTAAAAEANATVRTISRVIIDPRWRGVGIAAALVRAYLAEPLTTRTEAIAAMGRACPFFVQAGMRPIPTRPARRARNLLKTLDEMHIQPWRLIHIERAQTLLRRSPRLRLALQRWANDSRATRAAAHRPGTSLAIAAAASLAAPPRVYVWP